LPAADWLPREQLGQPANVKIHKGAIHKIAIRKIVTDDHTRFTNVIPKKSIVTEGKVTVVLLRIK